MREEAGMLSVVLRKLKDGEVDRLRSWMAELNERQDEVRETFAQEGVMHERAYLLEMEKGPVLVYAIEARDFEAASRAYNDSTLPIDLEHRKVMSKVLAEPADADLVYECQADASPVRRVEFPADALDDFVLVRSDGHPLYHFCVCVDDADMRITHVLRGDDHLANTPKHVALFRALGAPVPAFAHLGMILGTDRKKLSKRYGAAAVEEWRDQGIFPEALVNFLALLGWSPGEDREILSREEMEREFSLERIGASPSVFDPEKLLWMNAQYMARMPAEELVERARPHAPAGVPEKEAALAAVELHRTRARTAIEMGRALSMYARDPEKYDPEGMKKNVRPETAAELERLIAKFEGVSSWSALELDAALRELAAEMKVSASRLIHPTRLGLTGITVGAPLFDVVALLGKETALRRLRKFVERIRDK